MTTEPRAIPAAQRRNHWMNALPRNAGGKVMKDVLRSQAWPLFFWLRRLPRTPER